jgi:hypothetical protein
MESRIWNESPESIPLSKVTIYPVTTSTTTVAILAGRPLARIMVRTPLAHCFPSTSPSSRRPSRSAPPHAQSQPAPHALCLPRPPPSPCPPMALRPPWPRSRPRPSATASRASTPHLSARSKSRRPQLPSAAAPTSSSSPTSSRWPMPCPPKTPSSWTRRPSAARASNPAPVP